MGEHLWREHAAQWARLGPPLRPSEDDVAAFTALAVAPEALRVLVLGVTPELVRLPWARGTALTAVERSDAVLRAVWPGWDGPGAGAVLGDWRTVALPEAGFDRIVGDGVLTALGDDAPALLARARRGLAPDGRLVLRVFLRPDVAEDPAAIHADALAGRIGSFHAYKVRLAMAARDDGRAVRTRAVWDAWRRDGPSPEALAEATGWSRETIGTFDAYRDEGAVLVFPTAAELRAQADAAGLVEVAWRVPPGPLGARFPTVAWRPA